MFRPKEAFETFRSLTPKNPVGFRAQPIEFTPKTVSNGFDKSRDFIVFNLNQSWDEMKRKRRVFKALFKEIVDYGGREREVDQPLNTPRQALNYYQNHPEEYFAALYLNFLGIRGWFYSKMSPIPFIDPYFGKAKVPLKYIAGLVTLAAKDFEEVSERIATKRPELLDLSSNYSGLHFMNSLLERRIIRKTLRVVVTSR